MFSFKSSYLVKKKNWIVTTWLILGYLEMGRTKTNSGGGGGASQSPMTSEGSTSTAVAETRIKDLLKELYGLIHQIQVWFLAPDLDPGTQLIVYMANKLICVKMGLHLVTRYLDIHVRYVQSI